MIKKFHQFNESVFALLSVEDVEDQFLRLKEVLNCGIKIQVEKGYKSSVRMKYFYIIRISDANDIAFDADANDITFDANDITNVLEELKQVKYRIEIMYPTLEAYIIIRKKDEFLSYCYMCEKIDKLHNDEFFNRMMIEERGLWEILN